MIDQRVFRINGNSCIWFLIKGYSSEKDRLDNTIRNNDVYNYEFVPVKKNIIRARDRKLELDGDLKFSETHRFDRLDKLFNSSTLKYFKVIYL